MLLTALATLGLGIGLNAAIFAILFPSGTSSQTDLVLIRKADAAGQRIDVSSQDAYEVAQHSDWFTDAFSQARWESRIEGQRVRGLVVSENYFSALAIASVLNPNPPRGELPEIAISRRAALGLFSSPLAPVGRIVSLNGCRVRIAGSVPAGFTGAEMAPSDFWIFEQSAKSCLSAGAPPVPNEAIGHVRSGLGMPPPIPTAGGSQFVFSDVNRPFLLPADKKKALSPIAFAFFLSLTIPCINVANLMLARSLSKHREIGIRLALGATRAQIARLLLGDGIAIGILSALVAFPVAWLGVQLLEVLLFAGRSLPIAAAMRSNVPLFGIDYRVFCSCVASGIVASILFSVGPALRASGQPVCESLRGEVAGIRISRVLRGTTLAQVTFCAAVLAVSAALLMNVHALARVSPGFDARGVFTLDSASDPVATWHSLEGAEGVISSALRGRADSFRIDSAGDDAPTSLISSRYFETLGIPLRTGRDFTPEEVEDSAGVAIVSAATARSLWPGEPALGMTISLDSFDLRNAGLPPDGPQRTVRVVGVAADVITGRLWEGVDRFRMYLPGAPRDSWPQLFVRSRSGRIPGFEATPLAESLANDRFLANIVAGISVALAAVMLILALSGMYSMFALTTELRMKEYAIRSAIGASPLSLFSKVTGSAALISLTGALLGLAIFLALDLLVLPNLEFPLLGSRAAVYAGVPALLLAAGLLSAFAPGLRASRSQVAALLRESVE
jgi:hypothetical protein